MTELTPNRYTGHGNQKEKQLGQMGLMLTGNKRIFRECTEIRVELNHGNIGIVIIGEEMDKINA